MFYTLLGFGLTIWAGVLLFTSGNDAKFWAILALGLGYNILGDLAAHKQKCGR